MTAQEFMRAVANGRQDLIQQLLEILTETGAEYCVIGGLAVNAYAEPVVSLDLDLVIAATNVELVREQGKSRGLTAERFEHSINLSSPASDLRVQLQTNERYQSFLPRAQTMRVLGYSMKVAAVEDVLQGKLWACQDQSRRRSKRQKDLSDIARLIERRPELERLLPSEIRAQLL